MNEEILKLQEEVEGLKKTVKAHQHHLTAIQDVLTNMMTKIMKKDDEFSAALNITTTAVLELIEEKETENGVFTERH